MLDVGKKVTTVYLTAPYAGMEKPTAVVLRRVARKIRDKGSAVVCPILQFHSMGCTGENYPARQDLPVITAAIERADVVMVVCLGGWATSEMIQHEIAIAENDGVPVVYLDPAMFSVNQG